jgi:hypothetical protein
VTRWSEFFSAIQERGLLAAASAHFRLFLDQRFDRKFHLDTCGLIDVADLTCDSGNQRYGTCYQPTPALILQSVLTNLREDWGDFTFIDFGSGKGRALVLASNFNFRRIIGIEFAKEMHQIARKNLSVYRSDRQRCFALESVFADATLFPLPPENCVLYFFNPFKKEVMERVLDNIEHSYLQLPRKMFLIYYQPKLSELIDHREVLRPLSKTSLGFCLASAPPFQKKVRIYETLPAVAAAPTGSGFRRTGKRDCARSAGTGSIR